jgi:hypothetical protein
MGCLLERDLLEVCECNVLCPCWIGENFAGRRLSAPAGVVLIAAAAGVVLGGI